MVIRSIRWRLQLWLAILLIGVLGGFGFVVHQLQGVALRNQLDEELGLRVAALNLAVRGGPGGNRDGRRPPPEGRGPGGDRTRREPPSAEGSRPERPSRPEPRIAPGVFETESDGSATDIHSAVWSREGTLLRRSTQGPDEIPLPPRPGRNTQIQGRTREGYRECYQFTEMGDCVLAGRSLDSVERAQLRLAWMLLGVGATVLAIGLGGGWWLSSRALRPVEEIRSAASRIAGGSLSERIVTTEPESEIGRLAAVLNAMFDRLEAAFARQRQFTADAAHELRTPISVLLVEAQTALARERSPESYRETIHASLAAAQQMRRLTESLLQLARLDEGSIGSQPGPVNLADIGRRCTTAIQALAASKGIRIESSLADAWCHGDPDRLGQVVTNLLANAIHYNQPNGRIDLVTRIADGQATLKVRDTGIGIAARDLPYVFDRFFRADRARSRAEGHSGLGLAISQAIVHAHHGRITVQSEPGRGSTFTMLLPGTTTPGSSAPNSA